MNLLSNSSSIHEPYPGLRPYHESEKDKFFGRDADCKILTDKILVHRLTLLFAATGVGKSSLLQAAVLPQLKSPSGENLDVAYYIDWVSDPLDGLKQAVRQALQDSGSWRPEIVYTPPADEKLLDFFSFCTLFVRQPLVVVLDQFEEFFRYQRGRDTFEPFLEQLTGVITAERLPLHLVFSMREDFALELNAFKKYLPLSVFGNLYRLEKLGRKAAQEAILSPLKNTGFRYEPELLEQLLQDLLSREMRRDADSPLADMTEMVEPPYLQITCRQLWEREQANPEKILRLKTYQAAGGAKGLLENYILTTLQALSESEKVLASHAFNHLIGQRGTKVAHTVPKLAELIQVGEAELDKVLDKLGKARILRGQKREDTLWYELYHDMFSAGLEKWNAGQKEKMRNRRLVKIGSAVAAGIIVLTGGTVWSMNHFNHHLRLARLVGSHVEVYRGREGWPDLFNQQRYEYETYLPDQDMEPDKRFQTRGILDYIDLNNELTGYRPFAERIHGYIEHGNFSKALELQEKAFSGSSSPELSRDVIRGLFSLKTRTGFGLVKQPALVDKQSSLNDTVFSLLQDNTLLFPLDELTHFPFFYSQLKRQIVIQPSIFDPRLLNKITNYLTDKNTAVRQTTAEALGRIGDPQAIPDLRNALKDEDESVRSSAADALGRIGDPQTIPDLRNALKDEDESVRSSAADALGRIGNPQAIPDLLNTLKDENESVRYFAASAFGQIGDPQAIPELRNTLKDENKSVRYCAASALGRIGDPQAIPELHNALKDENEDVRQYAASTLGQIGNPEAIPDLLNALKDENKSVRYAAAEALGRIGDPQAIPELRNIIKDGNKSVRYSAAEALGQIDDPEAIPDLLNALKDENESVRQNAASTLGGIGDPQAIPDLLNALKDENEFMHRYAVSALGRIGDPQAIPDLLNALKDENEFVRQNAAEAVGQIGDPQAIPDLLNVLKDENKSVRQNAASALGRIGDPEAIPDLLNALKDENESVRQNAAEAVGQIGDPQAIPDLLNVLKDENESVRQSAASALGRIGDPNQIQVDAVTPKEKEGTFKWANFFNDERLSSISGSVNDRKTLLQALNLSVSPERNQQLLTLAQKTDAHISIRQKAIETLAEFKDASLVEPLQPLKSHPQTQQNDYRTRRQGFTCTANTTRHFP